MIQENMVKNTVTFIKVQKISSLETFVYLLQQIMVNTQKFSSVLILGLPLWWHIIFGQNVQKMWFPIGK